MGILGIIMFLSGIALFFWVKGRNFNRTNQYGVQEYKSFWHAQGSNFVEGLTSLVASALILAGFFMAMDLLN